MKYILFTTIAFLMSLAYQQQTFHIYMIGDSTMSNKSEKAEPERGWGQLLPTFFTDKVRIHNHAQNGRSSKSFITEGRWKTVLDSLQPGDYVIIQFGHNDSKSDTARFTDPKTTYKTNLIKFVSEARSKGAIPILCTSIVRRKFDNEGKLTDTHGLYPIITREVATELNVPLIDLQKKSEKLVVELGPEMSKSIYLHTKPNEYPNRPKGTADDTHLNILGATKIAELAVESMKELNLPFMVYLNK